MSRIYFHSMTCDAELRGSERAHFGVLLGDIFAACLGALGSGEDLRHIIRPGSYLRNSPASLVIACRGGDDHFILDGKIVPGFAAILNTALAIGNRPLNLAARIHGQCEMHCFAEGKNRAWMAEIIEEGLRNGLYRADDSYAGWEPIRTFLLSESESPV